MTLQCNYDTHNLVETFSRLTNLASRGVCPHLSTNGNEIPILVVVDSWCGVKNKEGKASCGKGVGPNGYVAAANFTPEPVTVEVGIWTTDPKFITLSDNLKSIEKGAAEWLDTIHLTLSLHYCYHKGKRTESPLSDAIFWLKRDNLGLNRHSTMRYNVIRRSSFSALAYPGLAETSVITVYLSEPGEEPAEDSLFGRPAGTSLRISEAGAGSAEAALSERAQETHAQKRKVLFVSALECEYTAVRSLFSDIEPHMEDDDTAYESGVFRDERCEYEVFIVQCGVGLMNAFEHTANVIKHCAPDFACFVGIAGGIKDVNVFDVVVGDKVYNYESGKDGAVFQTRPDLCHSAKKLVAHAQKVVREKAWRQHPMVKTDIEMPNGFVGAIASGEKVVTADSSSAKRIKKSYGDSLALGMEDYGFLRATEQKVEAIVVRGIADLLKSPHDTPEEVRQKRAAENAAVLASEIIAECLCAKKTR